ncbi:phosphatidylinositol phospholipase [Leptospira sp. 'Mane']|uniref:phosphatidylinositol phospholipase n=1 Tax=Leptospira sp. 'Mane' TaxID=3387407 RepID=UPI00398B6A15
MSQPKRIAFQKFTNAMRKLSVEVNDTEICKRLDILMATSKDDLPLAQVNQLLADPKSFDPRAIPEPYTQYVRHFIYMVKRNGRLPSESRVSFGDGEDENHSRSKADSLAKKSAIPGKKTAPKKASKKK